MSVMNRRNAVFGWIAWAITKQAVRSKLNGTVHRDAASGRRKVVVPAAIAAAVGGAVLFWKRQAANGDHAGDH
jgi:hypothetical protein